MAEIIESNHLTNGIDNLESDGNTSFLRAARNGQLEKVLEHLKTSIDINTSNANGLNALHLASKDGHVEIVEELLKRGAIVDAATKKGNTALHIASLAGQEEVVKLLVHHGASVNVQSQNGFTPLYMAAQENHDNVVKFLLANGANQSLSTEDGFTPLAVAMQQGHDKVVTVLLENDTRGKVRLPALHIAAKKDDVRAAKLLLENDHNPDVTSKSGFTPLHIASHYGNQSIANLLIQKNADVNYAAKHNITPLHVAAKWGKSNMVSLLLEQGAHIEAKTRDGLTPLHCAARSGHEQVVEMLLERSAPISSKTKNGLAPLHMAAQGDHVDAAKILLSHRAPVDEVTVDYLTALHVGAHCGHVRVAKLLLDRQADANARALNGFTPLHIACKKNRIKVVELLLKHGACIGATTESGLTPLHVASFMGCMNIVIFLLQHDASADIPTVRGETPLHLAARANQTDIIRILLRNGAQVDARAREQQTPLHIASRLGNVDIVMLLLQHGAMVDNTTKDLYTALHIAAKEGQDEVAAVLIENGATLNATTKKGFTPLHLAAKYGHFKVAKLLLQKEAPVDAQGKNGVTPLHVASHYDHQNVALLLLEKGASPHANAKNGHTPLHIAARKNQMDIANTLLEYGAQPNAESKAGFTPLHLSSQEGHADISALLLENEAKSSHQSKNGLTPMHLCAQENKVAVAEILLKNEAEIDASTKGGYTPLHIASHYGQTDMVKFLLSNGADVKAKTSIGYTPLHQAAQQGHTNIVNLLLENSAQPNAVTNNGQTPLHIAQKLGYITVIDTLKEVTDNSNAETHSEEKYRVVAPEAMHETFLSDSEEEGEDTLLGDQTYRYLTADEMKSLGDDSLPIDVTRDERIDSNRMVGNDDPNAYPPRHIEDSISPERIHPNFVEYIKKTPDNIDISRHPVNIGKLHWKNFLVSFLVDARGGAMRGCRHSGVRVIVPPRCAPSPTRITCRYVRPQRTPHPPPLMEGEALASRVLELGPVGAKFLGPVIIEVPHFAALRGKEREIVILRSDNGESWKEHTVEATEDVLNDILKDSFDSDDLNQLEDASSGRITRIVTQDFPQYFAVISRIRQEVHAIGPEGGMVSSTVVPQVQAVFPQGALTKKIKVGLQAQPIDPELTAKLLGHGVAVSPVVTVEPRRRKFHKAITLSMPAPRAHSQGMINQYSGSAPTLRLLCSITGGTTRAQWEDVTGSTPLTFVNDCVSFTTTVSARFWLMDCRNVGDATKMATELYREAIHVPFIAKFAVFAKRIDPMEARLRVFCMTDDKEEKTLEYQEQFTEIAKSRDVEVLEGKSQYIEFAGNLVPITKSGEQLQFSFRAFKENRLPFSVRVKDQHAEAVSRCLFMREPKVQKGEPPQQPICILNIVLPDDIVSETISLTDSESLRQKYYANENFDYYRQDPRLADISNLLGEDWVQLANQLDLTSSEINVIKSEYPDSVAKQAQCMLRMWLSQSGNRAQSNTLENALRRLGREDIVKQCLNIDNRSQQLLKLRIEEKGKHRLKDDVSGEDITKQHKYSVKSERAYETQPDIIDKYSAEEKTFEPSDEEEDFNKTVPERREQIVKRLSIERTIPASSQRVEIVQEISSIKRQSLVEDKIAEVKQKTNIEPMKLTTIKPVSKILQEKKLLSETIETKTTEQNEIVSEIVSNAQDIELTMTDLPVQQAKDRRESVLLEEVTQRLESRKPIPKLITGEDPKSPKVSKTPPPSPADFALKDNQATTTQEWHAADEDPVSESKDYFTIKEEIEGKTTPNLCKLEEKLLDTHKSVDPPSVAFPNIESVEPINFKNILNETNAFIQSESKGDPPHPQIEHKSEFSESGRHKDKKPKKGILGSLKSFVRKSSAKQDEGMDDEVIDVIHEPSTPRKARLPTPPLSEDKLHKIEGEQNEVISGTWDALESNIVKEAEVKEDSKSKSKSMTEKETENVEIETVRSASPDNDTQISGLKVVTDSVKSEIIEKQDKEFSKESPKHGDKRKRSGILGFFSRKSKKSSEDTENINDDGTQQLSDEHSKRIISTNSFLSNEKMHYEDSFHKKPEPTKKEENLISSLPLKSVAESTYLKFDTDDLDYEPINIAESSNTPKLKKVQFDTPQVEPKRDASPPEKVICQLSAEAIGKVETTEDIVQKSGVSEVEKTIIVVKESEVSGVIPNGKVSSSKKEDEPKVCDVIFKDSSLDAPIPIEISSTEFLEKEKLMYDHPVSATFNKMKYEEIRLEEQKPQKKKIIKESDENVVKESRGGIFRIFNRKSEERKTPEKVTSLEKKEDKVEQISTTKHSHDQSVTTDLTEVETSFPHAKVIEFTNKFLLTEREFIDEGYKMESGPIIELTSDKSKSSKGKKFFRIFKRKSQEKESPKKKIPTLDDKNQSLDDLKREEDKSGIFEDIEKPVAAEGLKLTTKPPKHEKISKLVEDGSRHLKDSAHPIIEVKSGNVKELPVSVEDNLRLTQEFLVIEKEVYTDVEHQKPQEEKSIPQWEQKSRIVEEPIGIISEEELELKKEVKISKLASLPDKGKKIITQEDFKSIEMLETSVELNQEPMKELMQATDNFLNLENKFYDDAERKTTGVSQDKTTTSTLLDTSSSTKDKKSSKSKGIFQIFKKKPVDKKHDETSSSKTDSKTQDKAANFSVEVTSPLDTMPYKKADVVESQEIPEVETKIEHDFKPITQQFLVKEQISHDQAVEETVASSLEKSEDTRNLKRKIELNKEIIPGTDFKETLKEISEIKSSVELSKENKNGQSIEKIIQSTENFLNLENEFYYDVEKRTVDEKVEVKDQIPTDSYKEKKKPKDKGIFQIFKRKAEDKKQIETDDGKVESKSNIEKSADLSDKSSQRIPYEEENLKSLQGIPGKGGEAMQDFKQITHQFLKDEKITYDHALKPSKEIVFDNQVLLSEDKKQLQEGKSSEDKMKQSEPEFGIKTEETSGIKSTEEEGEKQSTKELMQATGIFLNLENQFYHDADRATAPVPQIDVAISSPQDVSISTKDKKSSKNKGIFHIFKRKSGDQKQIEKSDIKADFKSHDEADISSTPRHRALDKKEDDVDRQVISKDESEVVKDYKPITHQFLVEEQISYDHGLQTLIENKKASLEESVDGKNFIECELESSKKPILLSDLKSVEKTLKISKIEPFVEMSLENKDEPTTKKVIESTESFLNLENEFYHDSERKTWKDVGETGELEKDAVLSSEPTASLSKKDKKSSRNKGIFNIFKRKSGDQKQIETDFKSHGEADISSIEALSLRHTNVDRQETSKDESEVVPDFKPITQQFLVEEQISYDGLETLIENKITSLEKSVDEKNLIESEVGPSKKPISGSDLKSEEKTLEISKMESFVEMSLENKDKPITKEVIESTKSFLNLENEFYHDIERKIGKDVGETGELEKGAVLSSKPAAALSTSEKKSSKNQGIFQIFKRKSGDQKQIETEDAEPESKSHVKKSLQQIPDDKKNLKGAQEVPGPGIEIVHDFKQSTHKFLKDEKTFYDHEPKSSKKIVHDDQVLLSEGVIQLQKNMESLESKETHTKSGVESESKKIDGIKESSETSVENRNKPSMKELMEATDNFLSLENKFYHDVERREGAVEKHDIATSSPQDPLLTTKDKKSSKNKGIFSIFKRKSGDEKQIETSGIEADSKSHTGAPPTEELLQENVISHEILEKQKISHELKSTKKIVDEIKGNEPSKKDLMQATEKFLNLENESYEDIKKEAVEVKQDSDILTSSSMPTKEKKSSKTKGFFQIFKRKSEERQHSETDEIKGDTKLPDDANISKEDFSEKYIIPDPIENIETSQEETRHDFKSITQEFLEDAKLSYDDELEPSYDLLHDIQVNLLKQPIQQENIEFVEKTITYTELEPLKHPETTTTIIQQKIHSYSETTSEKIVNIQANKELTANQDEILEELLESIPPPSKTESKIETKHEPTKEIVIENLKNNEDRISPQFLHDFLNREKLFSSEENTRTPGEVNDLLKEEIVEMIQTKPIPQVEDHKQTGKGIFQIFGLNFGKKTDESENEKKDSVAIPPDQTAIELKEERDKKGSSGLDENQQEKKTKGVFKIFGKKEKKKPDDITITAPSTSAEVPPLKIEKVSDFIEKDIAATQIHSTEKIDEALLLQEVKERVTTDSEGTDPLLITKQMSTDQIEVQTEYEKSVIKEKIEPVTTKEEAPILSAKEMKQAAKKKKQKFRTKSLADGEEAEKGNKILNFFTRRSKSKDRDEMPEQKENKMSLEVLKNIEHCNSFLKKEVDLYNDVKLFDETQISSLNSNIPQTEIKKDSAIEKPHKKTGIFNFLKRKIKHEDKQIPSETEINESNLIDSAQFIRTEIDNFEDVRPEPVGIESNTHPSDVDVFETTTEVDNMNIIDVPEFTAFDFIKEEIENFEKTKALFTDTIDTSFRVDTEVENVEGDSPKEIIRKKIIITEKLIEKPSGQASGGNEISVKLLEKLEDVQEELRNKMAPREIKASFSRSESMKSTDKVIEGRSNIFQPKSGSQERIENVKTECTERIEDLKMARGDVIEDVSVLERSLEIISDNAPEKVTDLDDNPPDVLSRECTGLFQRMKINENIYQHEKLPSKVEVTKLNEKYTPQEKGVFLKNFESCATDMEEIETIGAKHNIPDPEKFDDFQGVVSNVGKIPSEQENAILVSLESDHPPLVTSPITTTKTLSYEDSSLSRPAIVSVSSDPSDNLVESPSKRKPLFRLESDDDETNLKMEKQFGSDEPIIYEVDNYRMDASANDEQVKKIEESGNVKEAHGRFIPKDFNPALASKSDVDIIEEKLRDLGKALDSLEMLNEIKDDNREKKLKRVERKFERMASEIIEQATATEQADKSPNTAENKQFQQLVSQLSTDEVISFQNEYSTLWDEYTFSKSDEWDSKTPDSQADILELPQGETTAKPSGSHDSSALKDESSQESSSDKQEGEIRSQPFDQHQLSDEMKELLKEMEKSTIQ